DAIGDNLTIRDAAHARLIEHRGCPLVEMYSAMPQAILAGRVVPASGLGHMGQQLQRIGVRFLAVERIRPLDRFVVCHPCVLGSYWRATQWPLSLLARKVEGAFA